MAVTDKQVRKLMSELNKHGQIGTAAIRAGMDRKTARKYRDAEKLPSEMKIPRTWRTREDPFEEEDWIDVRTRLEAAPELEAKTLFEYLTAKWPERYSEGQLRTLQRRIKRWRAQEGPPKEVFFAQEHRPGEAAQVDFTSMKELRITIDGELFDHLLCHFVLPYSNWQWATPCRSESIMSLRCGIQAGVFQLGHTPEFLQTDNSTAATHNARDEEGRFLSWNEEGKLPSNRRFNERYLGLMRHLGMKPRTTGIGAKEQNGDVESLNGALKRRLNQHLALRGARNFEHLGAYVAWLHDVLEKANKLRAARLAEELRVMRPVRVERLPEFETHELRVTHFSTLRVLHNTYSVPSRLRGERVAVRVYEDQLEVLHDGVAQVRIERLLGINHSRIDYRHVIDSLVRKPGAFPRYRYREAFFPTLAFRRTHDALHEVQSEWQADMEYLQILQLAARTIEAAVDATLVACLERGEVPRFAKVEERVCPRRSPVPVQAPPDVDLASYDSLLGKGVVA